MSVRDDEKVFIGPKLRRLRKDAGLTQAQLAERLGISTTYVNLMEGNNRPVSAKILIGLTQIFAVDLATLAQDSTAELVQRVRKALLDPAFRDYEVDRNAIEHFVGASPEASQAFMALYDRYRDLMLRVYSDANPLADREKVELMKDRSDPISKVREYFHKVNNYIPELEDIAANMHAQFTHNRTPIEQGIRAQLENTHKLKIQILPHHKMPATFGFFDYHKAGVDLSELLPPASRRFRLAYHCVQLMHGATIEALTKQAQFNDPTAEQLLRNSITNYMAAAVLMPYNAFFEAAETTRYDVDLLAHRFDTSFEQTAHRLTALQKPGRRGVPFFFVRVDAAGNISKRFSGGAFHFSKFGGACPKWHIHSSFAQPNQTLTQLVEMPDEARYISIAKAIPRSLGYHGRTPAQVAIGLGCEVQYAERLIYADELKGVAKQPTEIGVNCYLCDRQNCEARAHAPLNRKLRFSGFMRGISRFEFDDDEIEE